MRKYDPESVLLQFESSGKLMYDATLTGDYKTNNREGAKLIRIFKEFESNPGLYQKCLPILLTNPNIVIRSKAAAWCLALNWNIDEALRTLEEAAQEDTIFGFNAEMTLKVWHQQGYLKVYSK